VFFANVGRDSWRAQYLMDKIAGSQISGQP
jgi:hypothetical protein